MAACNPDLTVDSLKLVIQPQNQATHADLVSLGFRPIPTVPQLLYLILTEKDLIEVFKQLSQSLPEASQECCRFSLTRSPLDSRNLLMEFLQAEPLSVVTTSVKHDWFLQVLIQRTLFFKYQPIFNLASGDVIAYECLARATGEQNHCLSGKQLIDAAVSMQCIYEFDDLARTLCIDAIAAINQGETFFINVVPNAILHDPDSLDQNIQQALALGLNPQQIVFELTETEALVCCPELLRQLTRLREQGFGIAIDDLCGQVAIDHYLMALHPDVIKLDRQIVQGCAQHALQQILLKTLVYSAHELGILVIAEGLEDIEDIAFCRDLGVDLGQGFGLAKPEPTLQQQPLDWIKASAFRNRKKAPIISSPATKTVWLPTWKQRQSFAI